MHQNCVAKLKRLQYEIPRSGQFYTHMVGSHKRSIDVMWQCTLNMIEKGINIWHCSCSFLCFVQLLRFRKFYDFDFIEAIYVYDFIAKVSVHEIAKIKWFMFQTLWKNTKLKCR